jgi:ADP-heptose:LPS heptosyltransferase
VHQGPADAEPATALVEALGRGPQPVPTAVLVEPPLEALAAVLRAATAYLGADSGVSHLAAAVGAPALIVFAPGMRERWAPWGPGAVAIDATADAGDVDAAVSRLGALLADAPALLDMPGAPL